MKISYQIICKYWVENRKILIFWQIAFLLLGSIYLAITPKTYEAYFQVRTAKILVNDRWEALKWARYARRDLMSPQWFSADLVKDCMGEDGNAIRRSLVNSIQVDIIDDSGGLMGIAVRLAGIDSPKKCANLLAETLVKASDASLVKRLADDGFMAANVTKGKINQFEKPAVTFPVQMSDSYLRPQAAKVLLVGFIMALVLALGSVVLKGRYRGN